MESSPVRDGTDQRKAEKELRARGTHFRLLIEQASDGVFVSDAQGRYLEVNSAGASAIKTAKLVKTIAKVTGAAVGLGALGHGAASILGGSH